MSFYDFKQEQPNLFRQWLDHEITTELLSELNKLKFYAEKCILEQSPYSENMQEHEAKGICFRGQLAIINNVLRLIND